MIEINNKHLTLRPQCGICADIILTDERVIAIYGNDDSSSFNGRTRPFAFPPINLRGTVDVDGFGLCRSSRCGICAAKSGPEFVTIHFDCYSIFTKECHADMDGLWVRSAWRFPWRGAHPLHLSSQTLDSELLKRAAEICGLSGMCRLPCELFDMIYRYSKHSLFWRHIPVVQFASCVKGTAPKPLISFQLGQILSWKRNEYPEYIKLKTQLPIIRLTIDSDGISRVERLSCAPVYSGECNNSYRTIVQDVSQVAGIQVQVKDGLMRLKLPDGRPAPPIWNTPAPPDLASCEAYGTDNLSKQQIRKLSGSGPDCFFWQHLHAVEVEKIRGITFHFYLLTFAGIHIHYEEEPSAVNDKYEQFTNRRRQGGTWIYLPILKNDLLLAIDVRQGRRVGMNILARTRLVGDIIIGQPITGPWKDLCLSSSAPQTIVYSEPPEGSPVTFLGAYCKQLDQTEPPKLFPLEKCGSKPSALGHFQFFSWAPLDDVSSTLTFNERDRGRCKGIMFQYRNGGCRTVGQCRWHVDSAIRVEHPRVLQFKSDGHVVRVAFQHSEDEQADEGWECHSLKGYVAFWFTGGWSCLIIEANRAGPDVDMDIHKYMV